MKFALWFFDVNELNTIDGQILGKAVNLYLILCLLWKYNILTGQTIGASFQSHYFITCPLYV